MTANPVEEIDLPESSWVVLCALHRRYALEVRAGSLWVAGRDGAAVEIPPHCLDDLECRGLVVLVGDGEGRPVVTPRGACAARLWMKMETGDSRCDVRLNPGAK